LLFPRWPEAGGFAATARRRGNAYGLTPKELCWPDRNPNHQPEMPLYRRLLLIAPILAAISACAHSDGDARRLVVFFTADSAGLDDSAQSVIKQAADLARSNPSAPVRVLGFAAPDTGSPEYNHTLALARARNVADGLVAAGVANGRVRIQSRGAVPFEMMPTESRRVEIVVDL
jgi:OmpA family